MRPETQRLIAQEIRHQQEALTAQSRWLSQQPEGPTRREGFRRVNFWRNVLRDAEGKLSAVPVEQIGPIAVNT
jgi:hypothetical protein